MADWHNQLSLPRFHSLATLFPGPDFGLQVALVELRLLTQQSGPFPIPSLSENSPKMFKRGVVLMWPETKLSDVRDRAIDDVNPEHRTPRHD